MAEPEQDVKTEEERAFATTEIESGVEAGGARRLPTPVLVKDADEDGPDPLIGRVLGGLYKVEERIGEGGMGAVYAARHIHLNKRFAIKVLSRKIAEHQQAVERLKQEAVAASSIDHDNIVDVVSFDVTDDGLVFIVMELLKGRSLADLLEGTRLELPRALHIAHQICRALHAAHERDIVHRDLKPENVFVARKGDFDFVKVLDFGISKVKTAETEQVRMTKTGQLVGTPLYMSPEQAKGEQDVDRRTDIYALGVMLYEMLTGTPPFEGGNYFQLLWKHGNETPDPLRLRNPALPPRLEEVVMRALEKDPAARFQTMAEMEAALAEAVPEVAPPPGHFHSSMPSLPSMAGIPRADVAPKRSFGGWIAGIVLATVGAMLAIVWAMGEGEEPAETTDPDGVSGVVMAPSEAAGGEEGETAAPAVEEEEMPSGAETPTTVSISFDSRPPGATVTVGGEEIGTTPFVAPLPESADPIEVTFSLPRYADAVENLIPSEGASVTARLRSLRRGEPRTGAGTGMAWMDEL